jgi:hypothetical protein
LAEPSFNASSKDIETTAFLGSLLKDEKLIKNVRAIISFFIRKVLPVYGIKSPEFLRTLNKLI